MINHDKEGHSLFEVIAILENADEVERFLADLCTPQEVKSFKERFAVCKLLYSQRFSYREISEMTGVSTTTISRVARFLNNEPYQGYKNVLRKMKLTEGEGNDEKNTNS
ncbi:MAG: trp operon repressor [Holosporales bacterium]|nr:trp operon repressor [Holosporales bacterium]